MSGEMMRGASLFGGNWDNGRFAGSRYANVDNWPENSNDWISARGRSDDQTGFRAADAASDSARPRQPCRHPQPGAGTGGGDVNVRPLRILVGCECSGIVRRAFSALGHDAWSCDLKPAADRSNHHIVGDVRDQSRGGWDLLAVLHPPCTRLTNSGVRWLSVPPPGRTREEMWAELDAGCALFSDCWNADIERVAVENPVMHRHAKARIRNYQPFSQSVQPWWFGTDPDGPDNVKKRTCWWLKNLAPLTRSGTLDGSTARAEVHRMPPGPDRAERRSTFFPGMAAALALAWAGDARGAA